MSTEGMMSTLTAAYLAEKRCAQSSSLGEALAKHRRLIVLAATDPFAAAQMSRDPDVDPVLRETARAFAKGPLVTQAFRAMVDAALASKTDAKLWATLWREAEGPSHFATQLCELLAAE